MELSRQLTWSQERVELFHHRTRDQIEVDAVLENRRGQVVGIEVKAASTVRPDDFRGLRHLRDRLGDDFLVGLVLYTGHQTLPFADGLRANSDQCPLGSTSTSVTARKMTRSAGSARPRHCAAGSVRSRAPSEQLNRVAPRVHAGPHVRLRAVDPGRGRPSGPARQARRGPAVPPIPSGSGGVLHLSLEVSAVRIDPSARAGQRPPAPTAGPARRH